MKYVINENMPSFERRYIHLKKVIDEGIKYLIEEMDVCEWTLDEFVTEVCWMASDSWRELNLFNTDDPIHTIHDWVGEHFYDYLSNKFNYILSKKNCH